MKTAQACKIIDAYFRQRKNVSLRLVAEAVSLLGIIKVARDLQSHSRSDSGRELNE